MPEIRTPENTAIPGGGEWTWDADAGAWTEVKPTGFADTEPADLAAEADPAPTQQEA